MLIAPKEDNIDSPKHHDQATQDKVGMTFVKAAPEELMLCCSPEARAMRRGSRRFGKQAFVRAIDGSRETRRCNLSRPVVADFCRIGCQAEDNPLSHHPR